MGDDAVMTPESLAQRCRDIAGLSENAGAWTFVDRRIEKVIVE